MPLIYNGTEIPNTSSINYNGTSLTKVIYNGVTVWEKYVAPVDNNYYIFKDNAKRINYSYDIDGDDDAHITNDVIYACEAEDDDDSWASACLMWWNLPAGYTKATLVYTVGGDVNSSQIEALLGYISSSINLDLWDNSPQTAMSTCKNNGGWGIINSTPRAAGTYTMTLTFSSASSRNIVVDFGSRAPGYTTFTINNFYLTP